jgi:hypothetical protein
MLVQKGEKMRAKWIYVFMCASLLLSLAVTPVYAVGIHATDGDGIMSVSPGSVVYGSSGNSLTFTFTAVNDFATGDAIWLTVPSGWSAPTTGAGAGHTYVTNISCASGPSLASAGPLNIIVDLTDCKNGQQFTITYSNAVNSVFSGDFVAQTDISGGNGITAFNAGSPTVTITPKPLTVSDAGLTANGKTYDGNTDATLVVGSPTPVGAVGTDVVSIDATGTIVGTFNTRNAGTNMVTITGLALAGANAGNYTLTDPTRTAIIAKYPITVTAVSDTKTYDGSATSGGLPALDVTTPLIAGDTVLVWTQSFNNRNAGTGKTLIPAGSVGDSNGGLNYSYNFVTASGEITKLPITITAATDTKTYNGTTASGGQPTLSAGTPLASGDTAPAWTQTFDNKNVGTAKTITPAGLVNDANSGNNYQYTYTPDVTGVINKRPITITAVTSTKIYDGTTASSGHPIISAGTPLATGDTAPVWTQTFNNKNAGTGKTITPAGLVNDTNGGSNYQYTYVANATGVITKRPVTVTADAKSKVFGTLADPALTYHVTGGPLVAGDTLTLKRAPGTAVGVYPITILSFPAIGNYSVTYIGANLTITPILYFKSQGVNDGWILESTSLSSVGGTKNSTDTTFILGDDAAKRQYRSILSFDTSSLPNGAIVQSAVLMIKQSGVPVGTNPFTILGGLLLDIRTGFFGTPDLGISDFQLAPSAIGVGTIANTPVGGWYNAPLTLAGRSKINTIGLTQFRLYFVKGDNNDAKADYMKFFSGNSVSGQPQLTIRYTLP